jgi:hypothetical protein
MAVTAVEAKAATRKHIKSVLKGLSSDHMQQQSGYSLNIPSATGDACALSRTDKIPPIATAGSAIADRILQSTFFQRCSSLGLYITCERLREVDTQAVLAAALEAGKPGGLPGAWDVKHRQYTAAGITP